MPRSIPSALLTLAATMLPTGCGEPSDLVTAGESQYSVVVTPSTARLEEIGATQAFAASVLANGLPVDVEPEWSSADFTVVTPWLRGSGRPFVIASVEEEADSAIVSGHFVSTGPLSP